MNTPMTPLRVSPRFARHPRRRAQRGVILILTLVALVLLLIGVAAMVRTTDTATAVIGNLAFRRDLTNRAESAIATAKADVSAMSGTGRDSDNATINYSATRLANAAGIGVPTALVGDSAYPAGYKCVPASCTPGTDGIVLRWVIDRQCTGTNGTSVPFSTDVCGYVQAQPKSLTNWVRPPNGPARAVYRISVRVTGPRNTESYIQATAD
jgi:Tfp pilus assembly protein PilX